MFITRRVFTTALWLTGLAAGSFEKLSADEKFADEVLKVNATPTFFINGERVKGAIPFEEFDKRIKQLLKN